MSDFVLSKPSIDSEKILNIEEKEQVDNALKNSGCRLIHINADLAKNDYVDDLDRGTVIYNSKMRNYSFHKVIIPDGTIIEGLNFCQDKAGTNAIIGDNLTFIECNLVNVRFNPTWILVRSNNTQTEKSLSSMLIEEVL